MASPKAHKGLQSSPIVINDLPKFDLDSYISNYEGQTRIDRLVTIGTSSRPLSKDALKTALADAKGGKNVERYIDIVDYWYVTYPDDTSVAADTRWAEEKERAVAAETERLEGELKGYKNNLIKESIRMGNEDLGLHYHSTGDYASASRAYNGMRTYCTTSKHVAEMNLKLALVCISSRNWLSLSQCCNRVLSSALSPADSAKITPSIAPLQGLALLHSGDYAAAAHHFLATDATYMTLEPVAGLIPQRHIMTPNDIATYGALTALATLDRAELASKACLDSPSFRQFLELEPHLRRAIAAFVGAKYTTALATLDGYRADYLLDLHLQRHVGPLWGIIRRKSIVAFFEPFRRVGIKDMAQKFGGTEGEMGEELVEMIEAGTLDARVDLVNGLLVARGPGDAGMKRGVNGDESGAAAATMSRKALLERALEMAQVKERGMRLKLFRMNCVEAGWEIRGSTAGQGGGAAGKKVNW